MPNILNNLPLSLNEKFCLDKGIHIIGLPINKRTEINDIFGLDILGSKIQIMMSNGTWSEQYIIQGKGNRLFTNELVQHLNPLQVIKLSLKRKISVNWQVSFQSFRHKSEMYLAGINLDDALKYALLSQLIYDGGENLTLKSGFAFNKINDYQYISSTQKVSSEEKGIIRLIRKSFLQSDIDVDLQFAYFEEKDSLVIIFKGSDEPEDWVTNLDHKIDRTEKGFEIHSGFKKTLMHFIDTLNHFHESDSDPININGIEDFIDYYKNKKIILTGHSLGGALATLVACRLIKTGLPSDQIEVYSYGAPPVGAKSFCSDFYKTLKIYRFTNEKDFVPKINKITALRHIGRALKLPSNQGEKHSCDSYVDNILDCISEESKFVITPIT